MAPALAALDLALGQLQHVVCRLANGAKDRAARIGRGWVSFMARYARGNDMQYT